jgi:uncharacterized protein (UPF0335 family)
MGKQSDLKRRVKALGITSIENTSKGVTITVDPKKGSHRGLPASGLHEPPAPGHNGVQGDQLKSLIQRIERLEEEKKTISDDIREVYAEATSNGYDARIVRKVVAIRKRDYNERMEEETLIDLYLGAVGERV